MKGLQLKFYDLKSPSQSQEQGHSSSPESSALSAFINKKNKEIIEPFKAATILGVLTSFIYSLLFIYIYTSALYKGKISSKNFTMSEAFKHCEKRITVILLILLLCTFQFYFQQQNLYSNDFRRNSIPIASFIIVASLLLLFFVWPEEYDLHVVVSIFILFSIVYITSSVNSLYHEYYEHEGLENLERVSYVIVTFFFILLFVGLLNYVLYKRKFNISKGIILFGILEMIVMIGFSVFIFICSFLPALPNSGDLVCFYNKQKNTDAE